MLDDSGFFCFKHEVTERGSEVPRVYAFAYKPPGPLKAGVLDQLILELCSGPRVPDAIVVLGVRGDVGDELHREIKSPATELSRGRIERRIALVSGRYDLRSGKVVVALLDQSFRKDWIRIKEVVEAHATDWLKSGLRTIFNPNEVVLRAPPGYAYQKPSGTRSEIFLKPDLGLKSSASVGFVALCLFDRVYARNARNIASLRTVYVDTMAISPVAYALKDLLSLAGFNGAYQIESFHSYGGMEEVPQPLQGTSLCIISASTSMGMHAQWIVDKGVAPQEVVTLLSLTSAKLSDRALLAIELAGQPTPPGPVQHSIRIKGETFLPEQELARKVLLRDLVHRCDDEVKHFHLFAGKGVFDTYRRPAASGAASRAIFVDGSQLLNQSIFAGWLDRTLMQTVKASTKTIIFQEDSASQKLAQQVKSACETKLGLKAVAMVPARSLSTAKIEDAGGVIVCAAVIGKGSQLLEVSRTLRDKHTGPRLYLVGFQVTETRSELDTVRMNLVHSKEARHDFHRFGGVAVGTQLKTSFDQEKKRFYAQSASLAGLPSALSKRGKLLGGVSAVGSSALLPHGAKAADAMNIRLSFAYWPTTYAVGPHHAEVLGTIAVILQRAREDSKLASENRLWSATYQHVVLHPENFARFNDGVVQAALLRCAYPSELDYRADYSSSDFVKSLILRAIGRADEQAGEAVLEFLLALEQGRLQLVDTHRDQVYEAALACKRWPGLNRAVAFLRRAQTPSKMPF